MDSKTTSRLCMLFVAAFCTLLYWPILDFDFIDIDDPIHFVNNTKFRGLGPEQLSWMFLGHHGSAGYDPIAWLSYASDFVLYGLDPRGFHLTNLVVFVLFVLALQRLFLVLLDRAGRHVAGSEASIRRRHALVAALVAVLFAAHPLRVESVAWVSERHGTLAGLFGLLSVLAYLRYADPLRNAAQGTGWLVASILLYGLGVFCKSTIIGLPLCLAVLDWYPLRRAATEEGRIASPFGVLLREKLLYLVFALPAGWATLTARQSDGLWSRVEDFGVLDRLLQSAFAICFYVYKTLLPTDLSPIYLKIEYSERYPALYLTAAIVVGCASVLALLFLRRAPWLASTGLIYALLLAPVMGIFQSGPLVAADRYSLTALVPVFAVLAFGLDQLLAARRSLAPPIAIGAILAIGVWTAMTRDQMTHWRAADPLWEQIFAVSRDRGLMLYNRGAIRLQLDDYAGARHYLLAAADLRGDDPAVRDMLALAAEGQGDLAAAAAHYGEAIAISPTRYASLLGRAQMLRAQGRAAEAARDLELAMQAAPDRIEAPITLGFVLIDQSRWEEARAVLDEALAIEPESSVGRLLRAVSLANLQRLDEALDDLEVVLGRGAPRSAQESETIDRARHLRDQIRAARSAAPRD